MKKYIKKHLKTEKRIVKLLYKKGFLKENLSDLGWEYLLKGKKGRKRKGNVYKFSDWLPEIHFYTQDYWGEYDSHSIIDHFADLLWFENSKEQDDYGLPLEKQMSDKQLINYLNSLTTKVNDSKINKILRVSKE